MKPIVVRDQVRLEARRCVSLTLAGISYRLFRSMITVAILALAVAFLSHVVGFSLVEQSTKGLAYERLGQHRLLGQWLARLREPDPRAVVLGNLAGGNEPRLEEYRRWSGAGEVELRRAGEVAHDLLEVEGYLGSLPASASAVVLGDLRAEDVVQRLKDPAALEDFSHLLRQMNLPLPMPRERLEALVLRDQPWLEELVGGIQSGHRRAIEALRQAAGKAAPGELLAQAQQPGPRLRAAGFSIEDGAAGELSVQAQRLEDIQRIAPLIQVASVRAAIARRLGLEPNQIDVPSVIDWVGSRGRAQWLAEELSPFPTAVGLTADRIYYLARSQQEQERLQGVLGNSVPGAAGGVFNLPQRTRWLILVSFLVCAIGVVNAMMMSVTECFTEIATMKCLGALDGFLLQMFFYEAILQGVVGGVVGVVLGLLLAGLRGWVTLGSLVFAAVPWPDLAWTVAVSLVAGVVLAALAALGPAWAAARLPPMEAMRVE